MGELYPLSKQFHEFTDLALEVRDLEEMARSDVDEDLRSIAKAELAEKRQTLRRLEESLVIAILPKDETDSRNVILELRPAAGGDEAAIFSGDLLRMYFRFAETRGWAFEVLESVPAEHGGYKFVSATIAGDNVFGALKHESGVHRVQRVPATESQGRIHTSTVTVAVLPEPTEVDVELPESDLRIETMRASGPGGQHVNKTESKVRVVHLPTGLAVTIQDERSQLKNKEKAIKLLRARLFDLERQRQHEAYSAERRAKIGMGDRSEKIRTYNYQQGRITDHRVPISVHGQLQAVMEEGEGLGTITGALELFYRVQRMQEMSESEGFGGQFVPHKL